MADYTQTDVLKEDDDGTVFSMGDEAPPSDGLDEDFSHHSPSQGGGINTNLVLLVVTLVVGILLGVGIASAFGGSSSSSSSSSESTCKKPIEPAVQTKTHPLDQLSAAELKTIGKLVDVYAKENLGGGPSQYNFVALREPEKAAILKYELSGGTFTRDALVVVTIEKLFAFELSVDLVNSKVEQLKNVTGKQPSITLWEFQTVTGAILGDPDASAALKSRGVDTLDDVVCVPYSAGSYNQTKQDRLRSVRATCYVKKDTINFWCRPIEGLVFEIDITAMKIYNITDLYKGETKIPDAVNIDYAENSFKNPKDGPNLMYPYSKSGPSYNVKGSTVEWQGWKFHVRNDPRSGYILSLGTFEAPDDKPRSVFFEMSLAEMFVPYMESTYGWATKTFFDAGEYGFGMLTNPLVVGVAVPPGSYCWNTIVPNNIPDESGELGSEEIPNTLCIFERYHDSSEWLHFEPMADPPFYEIRAKTSLILRSIATLGNYDYYMDYQFNLDGSIKIAMGASGMLAVKGRFTDADMEWATQLSDSLGGVYHDHWFNFRLDLDVDGLQNTFESTHLKTQSIDPAQSGVPRTSGWKPEPTVVRTESEGQLHLNYNDPTIWRVVNNNSDHKNAAGHSRSYAIFPAANTISLLAPQDFAQIRAGFTEYNGWVTQYNRNEIYASGNLPNQNPDKDGLPLWVEQNRSVDNTDIVFWYTLGFHHLPRVEDYPVMQTTWFEFTLAPVNFFDRNPAISLKNKQLDEEVCF